MNKPGKFYNNPSREDVGLNAATQPLTRDASGQQCKQKFFVYIVECRDKTYYTGYTNDLEHRIKVHNKGKGAKYIRSRSPGKIVWSKEYKYKHYAMSAEYKVKQLNRNQKQLLIDGMRLDKVLRRKNVKK